MSERIKDLYKNYKLVEKSLEDAIQEEFPIGAKVQFQLQRKELITTYEAEVVAKENDRPGYITVFNPKTNKARSIHAPEMLAMGRLEKM